MLKEYFKKQKAKAKLKQVFKSGEMYLPYELNNKVKLILPKIHHVGIDYKKKQLTYVFSIPFGLDPKEITKKEWLFEQQFGKEFELKQQGKKFTLTIYGEKLSEAIYDYEKYKDAIENMDLPIVGGYDMNGNLIVWDMADGKPHLLIAGENGSGKSVQCRQILTTLIQFKTPKELHLHLCDPKFTEFHLFENVEHVQGKIAFEMRHIYQVIQKVKKELDDRKKLIGGKHKMTGILQYNKKFKDKKLPFVILCIDEFAQLKKERDAIDLIEIISAQGRAFGIFLMLSTQRPDAKVMDGLIKQNITVRMGFRHADLINSRITNTIGAEKLSINDKGRFVLKMDEMLEVQAPYLTEEKASKILEPYKIIRVENEANHVHSEVIEAEFKEVKSPFGVLEDD